MIMKELLISDFQEMVNRFPENTAVEESGCAISYHRLNAQSNRLAWLLRDAAVTHEAIVAVMMPSCINLIASLLAVFKAGGVYMPVDLQFSRKRIAQMFEQTGCQHIITTNACREAVSAILQELDITVQHCFVLDEDTAVSAWLRAGLPVTINQRDISDKNPEAVVLPEDSNYIFYTSGSTGEAKAFLGMHRSLHHFISWEREEFKIDSSFRVSQLTQMTFDASLRDIFLPLTTGGALCIPPAACRTNMALLAGWLEAQRINLIHCVPSLFRLLTKELDAPGGSPRFPALRHILMAGEILYGRDIQQWREKVGDHVELVNLYGTSETTLAKTFHRIQTVPEDPTQAIHVGKPISGAFVAIINSNKQLCRPGEIGEIYIKTPYMTKGYFRNEELTRRAFVQNPLLAEKDIIYKTGDLGRYLPDRSVEVLGRQDEQVKINGIRVELNEIKQAVLGMPGIQEVFVTTHKNQEHQLELVCYYTAAGVDAAALRAFLQTELNQQLIPSYFMELEEFPLTLNGKIDKKALPKPDSLIISDADYEPVQTPLEQRLEDIYKAVLGLNRIGRKVSFFRIGGTSLKAMQVISRIYKELDISLKIADIFANPAIAQLAAVVACSQQQAPCGDIMPAAPADSYALSHGQQRLWILDQVQERQTAYNMPAAVKLAGRLDRAAFEKAIAALVARHESLRTVFITENGVPRQRILEVAQANNVHAYTDLRLLPDQQEAAQDLIQQEFDTPFDLAAGPLFRTRLLQLADDQYIFVYTLHHIISDGWSMEILISELTALYCAFAAGQDSPLPPLALQYKDYAAWQHRQLESGLLEPYREYWLQRFRDSIPVLNLPTDFNRPAVKTYAGDSVRFTLDEALTARLRTLAQEHNASLYMTLLSAIYTLLYRYTGQEDIVLGSPVAGRVHKDLESLIGFFVNTLALRMQVNGSESFTCLLEKVKAMTLEAFAHQQYPFDKLVDELATTRDLSRSPLFDVMVALQNIALPAGTPPSATGLSISPYEEEQGISKFDLTFNFNEEAGSLYGFVQYNTDLFMRERIERMVMHLKTLLSAIVEMPGVSLQTLDYLTGTEREQLLNTFNATRQPFPDIKTLTDLFEEQAQQQPEAVAVVFEDRRLTYGELNARANQLAHYLQSRHGVGRNDLVALMMDRSEWMVTAILAVLKAGAAYVPIDPAYPAERRRYILDDTQAPVLITDTAIVCDAEYTAGRVLPVQALWRQVAQQSTDNLASVNSVTDLAYVIYTSGSTGQPKGVMVPHRGVVNRIHWMQRHYGFTPADVVLQKTPYVFDVSVWEFFMTLCYGGRLVLCRKETIYDPARLVDLIEQEGVTNIHFVPSMFGAFLQGLNAEIAPRLRSLRHIYCSGEALKPEQVRQHHALLPCALHNLYGPTEASVDVSYYETRPDDSIVPIGKPIDNIQLYVLDRHLQLLPVGVPGELYIGGTGLARGYYNKVALTSDRFIDHPFTPGAKLYKTGDVARWLPDGNIEYLGRTDDQVKIRGFRIETGEIENVLLRHDAIAAAVVMARENRQGEKYLAAYFSSHHSIPEAALREYLKQQLPEYMMPAWLIPMSAIPLNVNGKADRKALPVPEELGYGAAATYVAPATPLEAEVAAIWEAVLERRGIGTQDNFFDIGGHSLKAIRIVSRICQQLQVQLALRDIFEHPTIAQLCALISRTQQRAGSIIRPAPVQEHYPVSHAQKRLWVLDQFEAGQVAYNLPGAFALEGPLDVAAFDRAFRALAERHEILRTTFLVQDGEPRQRIHAVADLGLQVALADLQGAPRETIDAWVQREAHTPFDLCAGPLVRATLLQTGAASYVFLLTLHHIISDGWSMSVLLEEVLVLYNAYRNNETPALPPLTIQYKDYAAWQQAQLEEAAVQAHRDYWHAQFGGEVPVLNLPADHPRPALQTANGDVVKCTLPPALSRALKALGNRQQASLFMVLLASVKALLYRYTGQEDIIVGTPVAGRDHYQLENQIGFYVNTLALRTQFAGNSSFEELLQQVKTVTMNAYDHQVYPFDRLVDELQLRRDMSRSPLFDIMVSLMDTEQQAVNQAAANSGVRISGYPLHAAISKFDLSFDFYEAGEELTVRLEYNTDLFSRARMERMLLHYVNLLQAVADNTGRPLHALDYLDAAEKQQLLHAFNDTALDYPAHRTILDLLDEQAARTPHVTAVVYGNRTLTYRQLDRQSGQLAQYLCRQAGIAPGNSIGMMTGRSERMLVYYLAILKCGAVYVPVDPDYPEDRIRHMVTDSGIKLLIADQPAPPCIQEMELPVLNPELHATAISQCPAERPAPVTPDTLTHIIYTSGSTGLPKGVVVNHRSVMNIAMSWRRDYQLETFDVCLLQMASISFDVFVGDVCRTFLHGGKMVIAPAELRTDPEGLYALMQQHQVNIFESTPALIIPFLDYVYTEQLDLSFMRLVILGADAVRVEDFKRLLQRFGAQFRIINSYGTTETTIDSSFYEAPVTQLPETGNVPIGKPMANTRFYVLDRQRQLLPWGIPGELYIGGHGVALGYLNRQTLTRERFLDDPFCPGGKMYRTGDMACWTADGNIAFLGRNDHQVKIRGYRIELGEIESALLTYPGMEQVVVAVKGEQEDDKRLVAWYTAAIAVNADVLKKHLQTRLPVYMIPACFIALDAMPLSENGKIDRKALPEPDLEGAAALNYAAPRTATETALLAIWQEVLGRERIGIHDNFFEIGGHSLKATRILSKVNKTLGVRIDLKTVFAHPTIAALGAAIDGASRDIFREIAPAPAQAFYPLSPAQKGLWILDQLEEELVSYNITEAIAINGPLDIPAFRAALQMLVARHEILRTTFHVVAGEPVQQVHEAAAAGFDLEVKDLRHDGANAALAEELVNEVLFTPFNLGAGPLFRARLIQQDVEQFIFVCALHHIIADGWSVDVIVAEVLELYNAYRQGAANPLQDLRIHYKDYVHWLHTELSGERLEAHRQYWLQQFSGEVPVLDLLTDYERPAVKTFNGDTIGFTLDETLLPALTQLAQQHGVTTFMLLTAAVKALLHRYSGQDDIVVGSPMAGRDHHDLARQIGLYVNTVALRTRLQPEGSFACLLQQVKQTVLGAYDHQLYPFEDLLKALSLEYDRSRAPLTDVWVQYMDSASGQVEVDGLSVSGYLQNGKVSKFDLSFEFVQSGPRINALIRYNTDLFRESTAAGMRDNFLRLLQTVVQNPACPLTALELCSAAGQEEDAFMDSLLK